MTNRNALFKRALSLFLVLAAVAVLTVLVQGPAGHAVTITAASKPGFALRDVNPDSANDPSTATGGRVERVVSTRDGAIWYAASEQGGLWKSVDAGGHWAHVDGHAPMMTRDVAIDPTRGTVYAASLFDGRVNSIAGIEVSTDGGTTWSHPPSATPPSNATCDSGPAVEPSAFSIAVRRDAPGHVFVGTSCGLARSTDGGATWTFLSPSPTGAAPSVWSVVVQSGGPQSMGILNICSNAGYFLSLDEGASWQQATHA